MLEAANYSAFETLRNGRRVEIRALRPDDQADLIAAVDRTSAQSLYRRFFGVRRGFTDKEIAFFLNVDFVNHVALVAVVDEGGYPTIVGGGRYVVVQPGTAEVAFAVVDEYQGQGIGAALMRHLAAIARRGEVKQFIAEVLPDNNPILKVFEKSGFRLSRRRPTSCTSRFSYCDRYASQAVFRSSAARRSRYLPSPPSNRSSVTSLPSPATFSLTPLDQQHRPEAVVSPPEISHCSEPLT